MPYLSVRQEDGAVVLVDPIYLVVPFNGPALSATLEFEALEDNAADLAQIAGRRHHFTLGSEWEFWGVLDSLEPIQSTHPGLQDLRQRAACKGVVSVFPEMHEAP
jgi:hypothetical protein